MSLDMPVAEQVKGSKSSMTIFGSGILWCVDLWDNLLIRMKVETAVRGCGVVFGSSRWCLRNVGCDSKSMFSAMIQHLERKQSLVVGVSMERICWVPFCAGEQICAKIGLFDDEHILAGERSAWHASSE